MRKSVSLVLTWGILCSSLSSVYSRVPQSLIDEIAREYQTFRGQSIKGLTQQPCRAIQFVYDLQQRFRQNKDQHIADMITAVISEGAGVGGIDTSRQANDTERMIAYSALYEAIDNKADIPTLTLEASSNFTLKEHQKVVHGIYLSKRDSKLSLKSSDFLKDDSSYRTLTRSSQEHSEQYIKNMSSLERYLKKTKILEQFVGQEKEKLTQSLRTSLTKYIVENNNKWIDPQDLKVAEQFFWNLYGDNISVEKSENLIKLFFEVKVNWRDFFSFYKIYSSGNIIFQDEEMGILLSIYRVFPDNQKRQDFFTFCESYFNKEYTLTKNRMRKSILLVYQASIGDKSKQAFLNFCEVYLKWDIQKKIKDLNKFWPIYQMFPNNQERQNFLKSLKNCCQSLFVEEMERFLPIYQTFFDDQARQTFLSFCKPLLRGDHYGRYSDTIKSLLPIYQAFPDDQARQTFLSFCEPYFRYEDQRASDINHLLPIYQSFPTEQEREGLMEFFNLCQQEKRRNGIDTSVLHDTFLIYQAFSDEYKRQDFLEFCKSLLGNIRDFWEFSKEMKRILPIYQAFSTAQKRQEFLDFCKPYIKNATINPFHPRNMVEILLPIYQNGERKEGFSKFMKRFYFINNNFKIITSYSSNLYLRYIRIHAALCPSTLEEDESIAISESLPVRDQIIERAYLEINLDSHLPVIDATDPNLLIIQNRTVANAHDFDAIYELDRELLWKETAGYQGKKGTKSLTIYNNQNKQDNYHTNKEVEDFIQYLDEELVKMEGKVGSSNLAPVKALDIVKQMLGLAKKGTGTTGGFAPYLGHSMYYAKPDSPQGDEMLGRVWLLMKIKAKKKKDEDLKKAVIVAILEAAEVSTSQVDTHCQTRMTGELMKLVSWQLPHSKLRPLIAAADLPAAQTEEDMKNRIISAHERAQQLFKRLKKEDSGNIRKVIEKHLEDGTDPELWERYEAYYDDLYRRTKNEDGKGYKLDENILKRDEHGNLVSFYQADGSKRETPQIVYYQAEFQVFEKAFTDLMRQEFEEQRGLKY